ncbi:Rnase Y domain-containing protein [endosymbiont GvMRE of Glomus versiforme]|uniref:Rnase Y domain-containing protein n=1 Tax=endosymbiont GvMRE of Glomus versiforme TaxID=2039283 RepID=UPI000EB8F71D|nr:Rnase Y domain-containing protein [endosymbiont GvMRE of Glomus versiforme]RHZ37652.1 Ribonuclease Y [endosymbiont GvMRE of Glomus versiforme]
MDFGIDKLIIIFLAILTLILLLIFWLWQKKLANQQEKLKKTQIQQQKKEINLITREEKLRLAQTSLAIQKKSLQKEEEKITNLNERLLQKGKIITEQIEKYDQKEQRLEEREKELHQKEQVNNNQLNQINKLHQEVEQKLWEVSQMDKKEAKETLFFRLKEKIKEDLDKQTQKEIKHNQEKVKEESTKIICLALEKYSSELVYSKTVNHLKTDDSRTVGRIIGKDGRNINFFRKLTGVDLLLNSENEVARRKPKESKKKEEWIIEISCFNSLRREIATRTLQRLINEQKFSPLQMETVFQEVSQEVDEIIRQSGEEVLHELQISSVHPELVKHLGKLKFRTSYGQNVLEHCLEVAKMAANIAAELGLDINLAKRAGLFHDIGKSVEDDGLSHVTSGVIIAKQYKEPEIVINAIASHHRNFPADNPYSFIVMAADTLSAARPGARGQQLEAYISRMESLEKLAKEFSEVEKIYAFQAGKEIWVIVNAKKVSDYQLLEVSEAIQNKIREQIIVPGEIIISVLRETKFTQKMNTLPQIGKPKKKKQINAKKEIL